MSMKTNRLLGLVLGLILFFSCSNNPVNQINDPLLNQIETLGNWRVFKTKYSRSLDDITTFTANGIIGDNIDIVLANETMLAAGSTSFGVSTILLTDIDNPKGKVKSYIGPNTGKASDRFGFSGLAIHPVTNTMYAWYGPEIVNLDTLQPIYSDAPDYTHAIYGAIPTSRFVIDANGHFWIGTSDLDSDGSPRNGSENGLFQITIEGGSATKDTILTSAVWHVYKDAENSIWASTIDGLYKIDHETGGPTLISFSASPKTENWYIEQMIEYKGTLYAIAKNFFHNANIDTEFALYSINNNNEFTHVADISQSNETFHKAGAFVYGDDDNSTLYFVLGATLRSLESIKEDNKRVDNFFTQSGFGQYSLCVHDNTLYSVGNYPGISVLNMNEPKKTVLTQASTAEQLISNNIFTMYVSSDQSTVNIGPYRAGGISQFTNNFLRNIAFDDESSISSFFDYGGDTYVQGSDALGKLTDDRIETVTSFYTNSERSTFDPSGYLWAYPNFGYMPTGVIAMMNLVTFEIKRTTTPNGVDHYKWHGNKLENPDLYWEFDQQYHYEHIIPIPDSTDMMIAVTGGSETGDFTTAPHTLRYSHASNMFTKVPIFDTSSQGILYMASDGTTLYGVASQKLLTLKESGWVEKFPISSVHDIRDMIIVGQYAIIASGVSAGSRAGFEVVHLTTGNTKHYTARNTPLPSDAVLSLAAQKLRESRYRLWFGTNNGLAYCEVDLP